MLEYPGLLDLIIIFADDDPAHRAQTLGVANSLSDLTGAEVVQFDIPVLSGFRSFVANIRKSQLLTGRKEEALSWLKCAKGEHLLRSVATFFSKTAVRENSRKVLLLAAGDNAAAYNLAVAITWKVACAVIDVPGRIGSGLFEFAIVPEYKNPPIQPNILKTVIPPNNIRAEILEAEAARLKERCHPKSENVWAVLLGGNDEHYRMTPKWLKQTMSMLIAKAELQDADLYITTSRRTPAGCDETLKQMAAENNVIRYLHIEAEDSSNPVSAFLGLADTVFCTEDSMNMISEAVTGGHRVVLLRTGRVKGIKRALLKLNENLIERGAIPRSYAFATVKFDLIFDRLKRHDKVMELRDWLKSGSTKSSLCNNLPDDGAVWGNFNEARRAAKWIAKSLVV